MQFRCEIWNLLITLCQSQFPHLKEGMITSISRQKPLQYKKRNHREANVCTLLSQPKKKKKKKKDLLWGLNVIMMRIYLYFEKNVIVFENYFNCAFIFPWVSTMINRRDRVGLGNSLGDDQFFQRLNYAKLPSLVSWFCKESVMYSVADAAGETWDWVHVEQRNHMRSEDASFLKALYAYIACLQDVRRDQESVLSQYFWVKKCQEYLKWQQAYHWKRNIVLGIWDCQKPL